MAETFTEKLKLSKRDTGDLNWGAGANANLDLLDAHSQQGTLRPPRTLLASLGSGAVGAELVGSTTYFYKITSFNATGETKENQIPVILEAQVTEPVTPVPIILQWETIKGAAGYRIYKSTTSGQERFLAEVTGEATANYTDDGNTAVNTGISVPTSNTALTALSGLRKTGETDFLRGDVELEQGPNIILTQDGPNKKITIEAVGGGGGGSYVTALVDAPTGVAATDTGNINTALSAAAGAGGGVVLLREGTYNINATINIGTGVTLQGMGRAATILLGDPTFGASSIISSSGADNGLRDLTVDENQPNRAGGSPFIGLLLNSQRLLVENCKFTRNKSTGSFVFLGGGSPGNGAMMRNCIVDNNGNALSTAIVQGGEVIDNCVLFQNQAGNVNDFMQQPGQVVNCRLLKNSGTISGAGMRFSSSNGIANGNGIFVGSGNNAIIIGGSAGTYIGNICQGGNIQLDAGAGNNTVIGNASAVIVDNSGASNQIANNS